MKKSLLLLAAAVLTTSAIAQTTVEIYATGAMGSFTTGNSSNTTRTDNNIVANAGFTPRRGYAVFDLASLPAGATITNVDLNFNIATVTGGGGTGWNTRGYVGDLSTITAAGTLYTTMGTAPTIWTTAYPNTPGSVNFASNAASVNYVQTNIGTKVSVVWSTSAFRTYTITGETGIPATSGTHAPFLAVTYTCPGITSLSATAPATNPCPNEAFTLTGSATGSIASYSWNGPFGFSSSSASPTVSSGLPANGSYTLTVTDAAGCTQRTTVIVTVNPAPVADIIPMTATAFCDGDNAQLSAVTPGLTYQWYDGTTAIPGATDQTYTTTTTGTYKVQVTDAVGCSAITSVAVPTVLLATPPVTPGDTILLCTGDNGTLTVNTNGVTTGINFQWQKNGVNIPAANGSSYLVTTSGTYRNVITVPATGCTSTSEEVMVIVNDYPLPTVTYSGSNLSTATYSQYQWFLNTVAIPGATNQTYHPTVPGSYRVRVKDAAGCTAYSPAYALNTTSVANIITTDIKLYPNPVNNILNIESPVTVSAIVSTVSGKALYSVHNATTINLADLTPGLYMVTVYDADGNRLTTQKVSKQ
jgi:hypothetical protein